MLMRYPYSAPCPGPVVENKNLVSQAGKFDGTGGYAEV